jgi:HEAT repeat protein
MISSEEIISKLNSSGISILELDSLLSRNRNYPEAVPIIIEFLENFEELCDNDLEVLIRALAIKEAKGKANSMLISIFLSLPLEKSSLQWSIGNTMEVIMNDKDVPSILQIVRNKAYGKSRQMFVLGLSKFKKPEVESTLIELLQDDDVALHALSSIGRQKAIAAISEIELVKNKYNSFFKRKAEKILDKLTTLREGK